MTKYWILIAPKNQVAAAVAGSYVEAGHGKGHPLKRMNEGDGFIYYCPKLEYGGEVQCQRFSAVGYVLGSALYTVDVGNQKVIYRRAVKYLPSGDASIKPLIFNLSFIKDKQHWGHIFKFGILQVQVTDFMLIAKMMDTKASAFA